MIRGPIVFLLNCSRAVSYHLEALDNLEVRPTLSQHQRDLIVVTSAVPPVFAFF